MIKAFYVFIPAMLLFLATPFITIEDKITVTHSYPTVVKAGDEFTVTLTIHNTDVKGFARLQQNLPPGFEAVNIESHGGDFVFEDQSIKYSWTQLPAANQFTVSYKVKTNKNVSGMRTINGIFVYVDDSKTQRLSLSSMEIKIDEAAAESANAPNITRKMITLSPDKGEYKVELIIHPNNINESAEFSDEIPSGFNAEVIEAYQSVFRFENNSAIFNWKKLPAEASFTIAYRVISGKPGPAPVINGVLVYGDVIYKMDETAKNDEKDIPNTVEADNKASKETLAVEQIDQNAPIIPITSFSKKPLIPLAEKGIYYKVQIAATKKSNNKDTEWFYANYHIESNVELTYHDGWKKYLIGSFEAYNDARAYNKKTKEKISDAFVVAYENGMRIPLSEARQHKNLNN